MTQHFGRAEGEFEFEEEEELEMGVIASEDSEDDEGCGSHSDQIREVAVRFRSATQVTEVTGSRRIRVRTTTNK